MSLRHCRLRSGAMLVCHRREKQTVSRYPRIPDPGGRTDLEKGLQTREWFLGSRSKTGLASQRRQLMTGLSPDMPRRIMDSIPWRRDKKPSKNLSSTESANRSFLNSSHVRPPAFDLKATALESEHTQLTDRRTEGMGNHESRLLSNSCIKNTQQVKKEIVREVIGKEQPEHRRRPSFLLISGLSRSK